MNESIKKETKSESKLRKFLNVLDGNKTIIGSITLAILQAVPIPEPYKTVSIGIISLLTGAALTSHIQKGYFRQDKGK